MTVYPKMNIQSIHEKTTDEPKLSWARFYIISDHVVIESVKSAKKTERLRDAHRLERHINERKCGLLDWNLEKKNNGRKVGEIVNIRGS